MIQMPNLSHANQIMSNQIKMTQIKKTTQTYLMKDYVRNV